MTLREAWQIIYQHSIAHRTDRVRFEEALKIVHAHFEPTPAAKPQKVSRGDLYQRYDGDERFLVVLDHDPATSPGEASIVDALVVTPANHHAAVGSRVLITADDLLEGWAALEVDDSGTS